MWAKWKTELFEWIWISRIIWRQSVNEEFFNTQVICFYSFNDAFRELVCSVGIEVGIVVKSVWLIRKGIGWIDHKCFFGVFDSQSLI